MNLRDYAPYYIGTPCYNTWFPPDHDEYNAGWVLRGFRTTSEKCYMLESELDITWTDSIKPILRRLEDMTEGEMVALLTSLFPFDMEDKPVADEFSIEMFYNDDGLMVDGDVSVGANYTCRCYEGQIAIKQCGSICFFDEAGNQEHGINVPKAFHYLLQQHFDLFGLIPAGLAIDAKTITT